MAAALTSAVPASAETHGPCGGHLEGNWWYFTNCSYYATFVKVSDRPTGSWTICIPGKYKRSFGGRDRHKSIVAIRHMDGPYCDWQTG